MSLNKSLRRARRRKNDEFYTQLSDIEAELRHYARHFRGKVVYCNCDDPRVSKFFHYFSYNFERLGLKKLITACYRNQDRDLFSRHDSKRAIWLEYKGNSKGGRMPDVEDIGVHMFEGDGDFRSTECIELLTQADIVVTNPPFSLFREYVAQLMEHGKRFLIVGSQNAITYKEIFPLIKDNRMWLGITPNSPWKKSLCGRRLTGVRLRSYVGFCQGGQRWRSGGGARDGSRRCSWRPARSGRWATRSTAR